jgi:hypothetical protein
MQQLQVLTHFNFCRHHTLHLSVIILPSECWLYTIEKKIDKREGTENWNEIQKDILPFEWLYTMEKKIVKREGTDNWKEIHEHAFKYYRTTTVISIRTTIDVTFNIDNKIVYILFTNRRSF